MLRATFETTTTETAALFGGETDPLTLTYWADGDEIFAAMVDYVAALRRTVDRAAEAGDFLPGRENYSAQRSLEILNRIIGATGCELPCLPVAAA